MARLQNLCKELLYILWYLFSVVAEMSFHSELLNICSYLCIYGKPNGDHLKVLSVLQRYSFKFHVPWQDRSRKGKIEATSRNACI